MYMLNGWWFLSSGGAYPLVFTVGSTEICYLLIFVFHLSIYIASIATSQANLHPYGTPLFDNGPLPELCITFHLHYISFALHLKNLPRQHEMPAMSRFKCHALYLHFMK